MKNNAKNNETKVSVSVNETDVNYSAGMDFDEPDRLLAKVELLVWNCIRDLSFPEDVDTALLMMRDYVERLNMREITYTYDRICRNLSFPKMTDVLFEIFADQIAQAKKTNDIFRYDGDTETTAPNVI